MKRLALSMLLLVGLTARARAEEPRAELRLEPRHPPRQDRLRHPHPLAGAAERAGLDHPHEGEDVEQIGGGMFHDQARSRVSLSATP